MPATYFRFPSKSVVKPGSNGSLLEEGPRSARGLNPAVSRARRVGRVREGLVEDGISKGRRISKGEGAGSSLPTSCFVLG